MLDDNDGAAAGLFQTHNIPAMTHNIPTTTHNIPATTHNITATTHNITAALESQIVTTTQNILNTGTRSFFDPKVLAAVWYEHKVTDAWLVPVIVILGGIVLIVSVVMMFVMRWVADRVCMYCHKVCGCCGPSSPGMDNEQTHLTGARRDNIDVK